MLQPDSLDARILLRDSFANALDGHAWFESSSASMFTDGVTAGVRVYTNARAYNHGVVKQSVTVAVDKVPAGLVPVQLFQTKY